MFRGSLPPSPAYASAWGTQLRQTRAQAVDALFIYRREVPRSSTQSRSDRNQSRCQLLCKVVNPWPISPGTGMVWSMNEQPLGKPVVTPPGPPALSPMQPALGRQRHGYLDALRGIAILGILPANIPLFALPIMASSDPPPLSAETWPGALAHLGTRMFVDYKFITIFSLLFGVGLALIHDRCTARGRPFARLYLRRLFVLAGFGAAHVVFLWYGDVLLFYAMCGLCAMWLSGRSPRLLTQLGCAAIALPALFLLGVTILVATLQQTDSGAGWLAEAAAQMQPPAADVHFVNLSFAQRLQHWGSPELELFTFAHGSYVEMIVVRLLNYAMSSIFFALYFSWRTFGLFLIGMAMLKAGWFVDPVGHPRPFARLTGFGFGLGVPFQLFSVYLAASGFGAYANGWLAEFCQYAGSLGVAMGYVGAVGLVYRRWPAISLVQRLSAVGRMALSNYILESVLCVLVFYSFGLGLFGTIDRASLLVVVLAVWTVALAWSPVWLARYQFGPLEWVWRRLTYGKSLASFKRPPVDASGP